MSELPQNKLARNSDPNILWVVFRQRLDLVIARAHAAGLHAHVFEAWRSAERQDRLFAQGRTEPGSIVTRARAWESWHQYAVAADLVFDGQEQDGIQWDWSGGYGKPKGVGQWNELGKIIVDCGLEWYGAPGAPFREMPHCQLTGGLKIAQARALYKAGGLAAVHDSIANLVVKAAA